MSILARLSKKHEIPEILSYICKIASLDNKFSFIQFHEEAFQLNLMKFLIRRRNEDDKLKTLLGEIPADCNSLSDVIGPGVVALMVGLGGEVKVIADLKKTSPVQRKGKRKATPLAQLNSKRVCIILVQVFFCLSFLTPS